MATKKTTKEAVKEEPTNAPQRHALLSPSKASRWCHCTPSARMEALIPDDAPSAAAEEGTKAHKLAADIISKAADVDLTEYDFDMIDGAYLYNDIIDQAYLEALHVEEELDLSDIVPEGFGTCDAWGYKRKEIDKIELHIYDYKFGRGVEVQAEDNYQLAIYAAGALSRLNDLAVRYNRTRSTVIMHIVQPRIDSCGKHKTWTLTIPELEHWVNANVKTQAVDAYNGEGETIKGDWCRWCRAKAICKAQAAGAPMLGDTLKPTSALSDEEVAYYLRTADDTIKWLEEIKAYALKRTLTDGHEWAGMILAEGRSLRQWATEEAGKTAVAKLIAQSGKTEDEIAPRTPLSLSKLERLVGKKTFAAICGEYVIKPQGAPKLVPADTEGAKPYTRLDAFDDETK